MAETPLNEREFRDFKRIWTKLSKAAHEHALNAGFWDSNRSDGEAIALMHSELSELLEALRHPNTTKSKLEAFSPVEEEVADIIIRLMDWTTHYEVRVPDAIVAKIAYNRTRQRMHG